jgi:NADH-quinone oxidoreductase subunit J
VTVVEVVFYIFGGWAVLSALLCITRSNPLASALWLVSTMFALAAMFVLLQAEFIAVIQVLVYAGAVMVLFLFVIMLLNLDLVPHEWKRWPGWVVGGGLAAVMGAMLLSLAVYTPARLAREVSTMPGPVDPNLVFPEGHAFVVANATQGAIGSIAQPLFQGYLVPFEITSVLLLAAAVGAVVLAKKKI